MSYLQSIILFFSKAASLSGGRQERKEFSRTVNEQNLVRLFETLGVLLGEVGRLKIELR